MNCKKYFEKSTSSKLFCKITDLYSYALISSIILSLFLHLDLTNFLLLLGIYYLLDRIYYLYGNHINHLLYVSSIFFITFFICATILSCSKTISFLQKLLYSLFLSTIIFLITILYIDMIQKIRNNLRCLN